MRYLISLPIYTSTKPASHAYVSYGLFVLTYPATPDELRTHEKQHARQMRERVALRRKMYQEWKNHSHS